MAVSRAGPGMETLLFHSADILGREVWTRAGDLAEKLPKSLSFPNICSGSGRQSESINLDEMYVCRGVAGPRRKSQAASQGRVNVILGKQLKDKNNQTGDSLRGHRPDDL